MPEFEDVLVLAHGTGDDVENKRWMAYLDARADAVRKSAPYRRVQVETLREDWPEKREPAERRIRDFVQHASASGGKKQKVGRYQHANREHGIKQSHAGSSFRGWSLHFSHPTEGGSLGG